jgi:hypothetical protein
LTVSSFGGHTLSMLKRLNVELDEVLHVELKVYAARNGMSLKTLVETAVREKMTRERDGADVGAKDRNVRDAVETLVRYFDGVPSSQDPSAVPSSLEPDSEGGSRARAFPTRAAS